MKALFFFLLGAAAGAYGMYVYTGRETGARDNVSAKLQQWHLTPDEIRADLARTGQVVRTSAGTAGERINDARIVGVIKAKCLLDRDLSAIDIHVQSTDGVVALSGTVASPALVGRATALALDTKGVHTVTARLTVQAGQ